MVTEMRPGLLVTCDLPAPVAARAESAFSVRRWRRADGNLPPAAQGMAAVLISGATSLDATAVAALPASLRVLGTFSVGVDHIDTDACAARGLPVVNTPGVLSEATAELTMLLLLAAARRAGEAERLLRAGDWRGWSPTWLLGTQVSGKRLGIFGMGRIGQVLARMARGFGMTVHYHNRSRLPAALEAGAIYHAEDNDFLGAVDMLALCAPGGAETRGWLNAHRLAVLRPGAVVVNTARGSLVDDDALMAALRSGQLAAAGLDVFVDEPRVPAGYLALENVVLLPHIGSATVETRTAMGMLALDGIEAVLAGRRPGNLV